MWFNFILILFNSILNYYNLHKFYINYLFVLFFASNTFDTEFHVTIINIAHMTTMMSKIMICSILDKKNGWNSISIWFTCNLLCLIMWFIFLNIMAHHFRGFMSPLCFINQYFIDLFIIYPLIIIIKFELFGRI